MTRQMADDEVLRVIEAAYFAVPDNRGDLAEQLHHAEKYVAALQAERDALRKHSDQLAGERFSDRNHTALQSRAERAESALEALRGQVAGVVDAAEAVLEFPNTGPSHDWLRAELLAMKNSGEF